MIIIRKFKSKEEQLKKLEEIEEEIDSIEEVFKINNRSVDFIDAVDTMNAVNSSIILEGKKEEVMKNREKIITKKESFDINDEKKYKFKEGDLNFWNKKR